MTTDEKLKAIMMWTDDFTMDPRANGTVVAYTKLNKYSSPFTITFASRKECIDVRYTMVHSRVYQLCLHISETGLERGESDNTWNQ